MTMISRGVEISIAGAEGEIVRGLYFRPFFFFFSFFVIMCYLFLGTKSLMQRWL